jgi:GNAT superfamily N-acetyltransferase
VSVRTAVSGDIPALIAIRGAVEENRLADPASITEGDYAPFVAAGCCWLWEEDGRALGFSALDLKQGSLWALFVAPGAHGRGIGRALLGAAVARARAEGLQALTLTTARGTRAERFYRAAGWLPAGGAENGDLRFILTL